MGAGESVQRGNLDPEPLIVDAKESVAKGFWLQARKTFNTALAAARMRDGEAGITEARIEALVGDMYLRQRAFREAMETFQKAQDIFDICRKRKDGEKPTIDEYKQVMNNLAFSQYNAAQQLKSKDSKEFKELNQSALNKWKIIAQMRQGGKHDANIAETLTLMACVHMQQNNLGEARKLLVRTGEIQEKQGVPRAATRRLYKSVTSAMVFANAAILIQRKIRRKLRWIRFRRLLQHQREVLEEEEHAVRDSIYTFEDDCSDAWVILFFNCSSYVWTHDTKRIEIIREKLIQVTRRQDVIIEELFDEEEAMRDMMFQQFFAAKQWIEDAPQRKVREVEDVVRRETNERDSLSEMYFDGWAHIEEAMRDGEIAAKQKEHDRIRRVFGGCIDGEESDRVVVESNEDNDWNKMWKDYMAGKMKILGERIARLEGQRQDVVKEEEIARKKIVPAEHDFRAEMARLEEEERKRLQAWLEARNRAIKEITKEEEDARRHIRNRYKDISAPWEAAFAEGLAKAKAAEEARVAEERRRFIAACSKVEREETKVRTDVVGELDDDYEKLMALFKKAHAEALKAEEIGNKRRAVQAQRAVHKEQMERNAADKEKEKIELQKKKEDEKKVELGGGLGLAAEAHAHLRADMIAADDHLQGHDAFEVPVARLVHDAHAASPQLAEDLVVGHELDFLGAGRPVDDLHLLRQRFGLLLVDLQRHGQRGVRAQHRAPVQGVVQFEHAANDALMPLESLQIIPKHGLAAVLAVQRQFVGEEVEEQSVFEQFGAVVQIAFDRDELAA